MSPPTFGGPGKFPEVTSFFGGMGGTYVRRSSNAYTITSNKPIVQVRSSPLGIRWPWTLHLNVYIVTGHVWLTIPTLLSPQI